MIDSQKNVVDGLSLNISDEECGYEVEKETPNEKHGLQNGASFFSGVLFALGLGVSGMTDTTKVIGFLTLDSNWNPALMLVMGGAIAVHFVLFRIVKKRESPFFSDIFHVPTRTDFTFRLVAGSVLFGLGWGLGGICPGPGLISLFSGAPEVFAFIGSMLVGMLLWQNVGDKLIK